jgi:hypothetical protein
MPTMQRCMDKTQKGVTIILDDMLTKEHDIDKM